MSVISEMRALLSEAEQDFSELVLDPSSEVSKIAAKHGLKFRKNPNRFPIALRKVFARSSHPKWGASDFLVKYAANIGKISGIKPIEEIGRFKTIELTVAAIAADSKERS